MKKDRSKLLIPCYKDIDAYDLPEEFAHLQAQNIGKIGFVSDLIRGIKKVVVKEEEKTLSQTTIIQNTNASAEPLVKRAFLFLEDEEWERADEFCEKALNIDPENAMAYLGKMLIFFKLKKLQDITSIEKQYWHNKNYQKAERFAYEGLKAQLLQYLQEYKENRYNVASEILNTAKKEEDFRLASAIFGGISDYKNSAELYEMCIKTLNLIKTWRNEYKVIEKECSNKNKQLSEMKKQYHKMREDYLNLKGSKDSLGNNSTMKSYLTLLGIYLISSTTAFVILNGETSTPLLSLLLVLTLMSSFCFGIAFLIQRWLFCKNSLRCNSYDNIVSTCIILFVPFSKYYFAFKDMKKFREMKDYSGYLENQVALCMNSMNQLGGEISTVENEIKQMKERMNTLSTQGNF
jgi:tetratricopeptide (TPR) repeat protein